MRFEIPVRLDVLAIAFAVVHFNERLPRGVSIRPEVVAAVAVTGGDSRRDTVSRASDGQIIILSFVFYTNVLIQKMQKIAKGFWTDSNSANDVNKTRS